MADNYMQSEYMHLVLEPEIDFEEMLETCEDCTYALAKTESSYYPADFPKHIPVGKDVDVLCLKAHIDQIISGLDALTGKYEQYEIRIIRNEYGVKIRFEKMKNLIFLVDFVCAERGLTEAFFTDALQARVRADGYYKLSASFECVYRLVAYIHDKTKKHHLDYIRMHRDAVDEKMLEKYCKCNAAGILKDIYSSED